jgi:hypothetical protein
MERDESGVLRTGHQSRTIDTHDFDYVILTLRASLVSRVHCDCGICIPRDPHRRGTLLSQQSEGRSQLSNTTAVSRLIQK